MNFHMWTIVILLCFNMTLFTMALVPGPNGWILHRPSEKVISFERYRTPVNGARVLHNLPALIGQESTKIQFEEVPGEEGYGFIRHVLTGKYVHPLGGSKNPPNDNLLVWYDGAHEACLFKFDMQNDYIIHKTSGKIWHPSSENVDPWVRGHVVLHSDRHSRATFIFANEQGAKMPPICPKACPVCPQ